MNIYKYYIYHTEQEQPKDYKVLKNEYNNIDTALHLFCRSKELEPSANADPVGPLKVTIEIDYFESEEEAREFLGQFLNWLRSKIQVEFYPSIELEQGH